MRVGCNGSPQTYEASRRVPSRPLCEVDALSIQESLDRLRPSEGFVGFGASLQLSFAVS